MVYSVTGVKIFLVFKKVDFLSLDNGYRSGIILVIDI